MFDKVGDLGFSDLSEIIKGMGISGGLQSVYYSQRHTAQPHRLLLSKHVIAQISKAANLNLQSPLLIGLFGSGVSHYALGKSKFTVEECGTVHVPDSGFARIGPCSSVHVEGRFSIGDSYVNSHARILCEDTISIGDGCAIAWEVELLDTDRHKITYDGEQQKVTAPIHIEDNVWIGNNVTIKKGVTVNEGAVVASGSLVTKDVQKNTLVGGTPAQVLRNDVDWEL